MPDRRDSIAIAATVVADTAWLYPALGVFGFVFDQRGSPLPLAIVLALIVLGVVVARAISSVVEDPAGRASYQAVLGLAAIYIALSVVAAEGGVDLLWGPRLIGGGFSGKAAIGLIVGTAASGYLWYRGVRIAVGADPQVRLLQTFRTGIVALAVAILAEQALDADFSATVMLVPFFAVSLAGLAFARLPPGGAWTRIVGLVVTAVVGGGLVTGLIGAVVGGRGLGLLAAGWNHLLAGISWLLTVLLVPVLEVIFAFVAWLIGDVPPRSRGGSPKELRDIDWLEHVATDGVPPFVDLVIQLVKYPLLLLAIYLLYRLLLWAYQVHAGRTRAVAAADRESIRGEADSTADLIKLALGLLPDWLLPGEPPAGPRYPQDKPGISEVYALYFDMLTAARDRGHDFAPSATPRERRPDLENAVPGAPVARITDCFNAACYGNIAADRETVERLRRELEGAASAG